MIKKFDQFFKQAEDAKLKCFFQEIQLKYSSVLFQCGIKADFMKRLDESFRESISISCIEKSQQDNFNRPPVEIIVQHPEQEDEIKPFTLQTSVKVHSADWNNWNKNTHGPWRQVGLLFYLNNHIRKLENCATQFESD